MKTKKDFKFKNYKHRSEPLKKIDALSEFPMDFWNYNINPITGYYIKPNQIGNDTSDEKKYKMKSSPLPKYNTKQFR
mgnify:CR=1 FL=1|tara:strand:+ start:2823 stop:3053 length:231 start_codon:yes stop_codon:yes gene_type:complete